MEAKWITEGFEAFRAGTFGNGGQNIYVSKKGILQRIHQTDLTKNGYVDLIFCNSQNHEEKVPLDVYSDPVNNPSSRKQLFVGGASSGVVADLNNNGWEDLVISCVWDGITHLVNSVIFFGSSEGLTNKYLNYLPASHAVDVAAGDFNGNGLIDLVFLLGDHLRIFYQGDFGFAPKEYSSFKIDCVSKLTAVKLEGNNYADLIIRKEDGAYSIIKGGKDGLQLEEGEITLLGKDEDFVKKITGRESYTQAVSEPQPRAQVISLKGIHYLCVFRIKSTLLYPFENYKLGTPIIFDCQNALALAAGDINADGFTDLVFACRDKSSGTEYSWIYPGSKSGWEHKNRIPVKTLNACDTVLADFTGNGFLDIVMCQSHSYESYTSEVLIFSIDKKDFSFKGYPVSLPAHDAQRVFVVHSGLGKKPYLVVNNLRSGSLIGNPDCNIYLGGPGGFHSANKLDLPGWGAADMVCCDLNDNGYPDIVFANASELSPWLDPGSYVYYNGPRGFNKEPDICLPTTRAHGIVCGDLNHNGYLDLVFTGFDNPDIVVCYGSEKGFLKEDSVKIPMIHNGKIYKESRYLGLADLNNNGWLDLIVSIITEDESFVLWGGPDGFSFDNKQVFKVRHACISKVADLNGNGYPDLIFGGHTPSTSGPHDAFVYIYWGSADGYSENRRSLLPSNAVNSMAVADFNNNGLLDLFVAAYQDGRLRDIDSHIYWNQGGEFLPDKRLPMRTHAVSGNFAADFNGNGWIDLAIANHKVNGNHISYSTVWHNGPDGFDEKNTTDLPTMGPHGMGSVDPGNIMDRSPDEYYISIPYQMPENMGIIEICLEGVIPPKCEAEAQFRFADSPDRLDDNPWRGPIGLNTWFKSGQRVDKHRFNGKWVQYRLNLKAYNSLSTPRISKVVVKFDNFK